MQTTKLYCAFSPQRSSVVSRLPCWPITINLCLMFAPLVAVGIAVGEANGHEFEDGFVERSVAVVVRDNVARLEYSIGLNPNTRQQLIKFWQSTDAARAGTEDGFKRKTGSEQPIEQTLDFYQLAADHLGRRLDIAVNDQRIEHRLISALPSSRHHVDVTVILEFSLPAADAQVPTSIEIADGNFFCEKTTQEKAAPATLKAMCNDPYLLPAPFGGGFRYAFKTTGSSVLSSSNVASILIRADRHLDEDFTNAQLESAFKIKAKVADIRGTRAKQGP